MTDDKKNIGPEVETPAEAPATGQPSPDPILTSEEAAILEHEGQAALFEMGEFVPDKPEPIVGGPTLVEQAELTVPDPSGMTESKTPTPHREAKQTAIPSKDDPTPTPSGKVVDFAAAREGAAKDKAPDKQGTTPRRGRPAKESKGDKSEKGKAKAPRDKMGLLTKSQYNHGRGNVHKKKDAHRRQDMAQIIRLRFKAVAERRQWSSAASKPRRKTRVKLWHLFWIAKVPSHQICRSFSACL